MTILSLVRKRILLAPKSNVDIEISTCQVMLKTSCYQLSSSVHVYIHVSIFLCGRYMTVLYYLNDVTRGGETAFPVADEEDFNQTVLFQNGLFHGQVFFFGGIFFLESYRVPCFVTPLPTME